jgi:hypothetical protein
MTQLDAAAAVGCLYVCESKDQDFKREHGQCKSEGKDFKRD